MLSLKLLDKIISALLANCLINNFSIMYKFKQDLAMAYFPDHSKESAGKLLAREIHTNEPLMSALQSTNYSPPTQTPPPKTNPNHLLLPRRALKRNRAPMSKIK